MRSTSIKALLVGVTATIIVAAAATVVTTSNTAPTTPSAAPTTAVVTAPQGPPDHPTTAQATTAQATATQAAQATTAVPKPKPKPAATVKPKPKPVKPRYTCDLDAPVKFGPDGNTIINRSCGYTDKDGQARSHDPWIDGQLTDPAVKAPKPKAKPKAVDPGVAALAACRAQKGWTTAQCIADAAAGNAS